MTTQHILGTPGVFIPTDFLTGGNTLLTGAPGSGKSYLLTQLHFTPDPRCVDTLLFDGTDAPELRALIAAALDSIEFRTNDDNYAPVILLLSTERTGITFGDLVDDGSGSVASMIARVVEEGPSAGIHTVFVATSDRPLDLEAGPFTQSIHMSSLHTGKTRMALKSDAIDMRLDFLWE